MHTFKVTHEVEVNYFPHYRKYYQFWYKVLDNTHCISITYIPDGELQCAKIEFEKIVPNNVFREGSYEIIEEEFNETFKRALRLIDTKNQNNNE